MIPFESTAIADDESHLALQRPLAKKPSGPFRVMMVLEETAQAERRLGHLEGIAPCSVHRDFVMSDEEFLGS